MGEPCGRPAHACPDGYYHLVWLDTHPIGHPDYGHPGDTTVRHLHRRPVLRSPGSPLWPGRFQAPSKGGLSRKAGDLMLWLFVVMFMLFVMNVPIAWSMTIAAAVFMAFGPHVPLQGMVQRM